MNGTEDKALTERQKYVAGFNETMLKIWQEQIELLGVIDTGRLRESPISLPVNADGKFVEISMTQEFLEYGIWQDMGTGKETPIGNPGDIGRTKVRKPRHWFSRKYFSSVLNLRDFLSDSIGREFIGIMANAFNADNIRRNSNYYKNKNV